MNRFDTVELLDGSQAIIIGVESLRGKDTGNILVSTGEDQKIVVRTEEVRLVKEHTKATTYPHIDNDFHY